MYLCTQRAIECLCESMPRQKHNINIMSVVPDAWAGLVCGVIHFCDQVKIVETSRVSFCPDVQHE